MRKHEVVVVGGGFGGVKAALELAGHKSFRVTLIANKPFFEYFPMMYHTATGGSKVVSSIPLGEVFKNKRIEILIDEAVKINRNKKTLKLKSGKNLKYDVMILALGNITNYFGIPGMEKYSFGVKSLADAEQLKSHLHKTMIEDKKSDSSYVVVGGGPTGIEVAGALPGYIKYLRKQHGIKDKRKVHVDLVEAAPRLMPRMNHAASRALAKRLRKLGVKLYFKKPVQSASADKLLLGGKPIRSHTIIWTAGMSNNPFFAANNFMLSKNGRVQVDQLLQAWPGVFVIGDNADTKYTGMAQTALSDAEFVANNLKRHVDGKRPHAYKPKRPAYVTPVGKGWAIFSYGSIQFYGRLGWWLRKAADWIGYADMEPWWKATDRLLSDRKREDNCLICETKSRALAE